MNVLTARMRPILAVITLGLGLGSHAAAEATADPAAVAPAATANHIHCEIFTLTDGRSLSGFYDSDKQAINIVSETSGKPLGSMNVAATDIVSRKPLDITIVAPKPRGSDGQWLDNYTLALASAHATNRPILIAFTGSDWCFWCKKLHKEVFSTEVFRAWAAQHVILLLADFPRQTQQPNALIEQNRHLEGVYAITGYPTVLLVDGDGTKLATSGYNSLDAKGWIADLSHQTKLWQ